MLQTVQDGLRKRFEAQRQAFDAEPFPSFAVRRSRLDRLLRLTDDHEAEFCAAIDADFGGRSTYETRIAELLVVRIGIRHTRRRLRGWMRERRVETQLPFLPGSNRLMPQPLGVVGIVSPWNYPFQLAVAPAAAALAAGNRVLIKPSELTPKCSHLLAELVGRYFDPTEMSVIEGDAEVGKSFVALPFDHLLFTGSTAVGREVARAAAGNLTPVTLELGGKSPTIIDKSASIDDAVAKIAYAKLINAGQTCIAPDYVLAPQGRGGEVAQKLAAAMRRLYPSFRDNPDYTAIVSDHHFGRLTGMAAEARDGGAEVIEVGAAEKSAANNRKLAPVIVRNADPNSRLLREEIFGPLLPIVEYADVGEAIGYVNARERPLALYWFGRDRTARRRVLSETVAGGVTINDCLLHFVQENQPRGGVGASGMGAYLGEWGFRTFSHQKPVFTQSRLGGGWILWPPFRALTERAIAMLRLLT